METLRLRRKKNFLDFFKGSQRDAAILRGKAANLVLHLGQIWRMSSSPPHTDEVYTDLNTLIQSPHPIYSLIYGKTCELHDVCMPNNGKKKVNF